MTKVKEIMKERIKPVSPSDSISVIARKLTDSMMSVVPVCENGRFQGIITQSDIISSVVATDCDPKETKAETIMTNYVPTILSGSDIVEAARLMARSGVHYLPVVNNTGKFIGLVTIDDLVTESLALAGMVLAKTSKG